MNRRGFLSRYSAAEFIIRGMLAVAVGAIGFVSATHSLAFAAGTKNTELALRLAPHDAQALAVEAQNLSIGQVTAGDRKHSDELARKALRADPTVVKAVTALGMNAKARGDGARARRLFEYADTLSRREIVTHMWAIEESARRGDISGAVMHYDMALRTSGRAPEVMFPPLAAAIANDEIRSSLVSILVRRPPWGSDFLDFAVANGPDTRATARLLQGLARRGYAVSEELSSLTVNRLIAAGFVADAWKFYATYRPRADRTRSRDSRFTESISTPSLFDWTPTDEAGVTAAVQRNAKGGAFEFVASSSVGGPLLQQTLRLPPGLYQLTGHSSEISQSADSRPFWVLKCASGTELGRVDMPNSADAKGLFSRQLRVPPGCPVQALILVAQPAQTMGGVGGRIDWVRLEPAGEKAAAGS